MTARLGDQPTFGGKPHLGYVPGQIILRVHEEAVRPYVEADDPLSVESIRRLPDNLVEPLDYLRREAGVRAVYPLFVSRRTRARAQAATTRGGRALPARQRQQIAVVASVAESESDELSGLAVVEVPKKEVSPELLRTVSRSPAIDFAERMPARWLSRTQQSEPMQNRQWGLRAINWYQATRPKSEEVTVAVLDTGIDAKHPDLRRLSIDYHHEGLSSRDIVGHGTHVAGIVSAMTNNGVGINGVARCKLLVYKVFGDVPARDGEYYVDNDRLLSALEAAGEAGAQVVNLSLGGIYPNPGEQLVINRLERLGVTVVAAMGNEFEVGNPTEYPAAYDNVFAVGATAETDLRSPFSNTGRHIQLAAPGSNILSTVPTSRSSDREEVNYASWSGTSMATPHVAAAAAFVRAKHPDWAPAEVKEHLVKTARKLADMKTKAFTQALGNGLLDLKRALS